MISTALNELPNPPRRRGRPGPVLREGELSVADYARRRGVSRPAVTQAIRAGRLRESIRLQDGRPIIANVALADREWGADRQPASTARTVAALDEARIGRSAPSDELGVPNIAVSRARFEAARAAMALMELQERKGRLVSIETTRAAVMEKFAMVRTRLLGLPTRIKQRLPHLSLEDVRIIDALIHEALEELANSNSKEG